MEADCIRLATANDLRATGALVAESCSEPAAHCLHSWSGESSDEVAVELAEIHARGELVYALAESAGGLLGAYGCEYDRELGRGWLLGPHARQDWDSVGSRLHGPLRAALPPGITRLTAFLNVANERGVAGG